MSFDNALHFIDDLRSASDDRAILSALNAATDHYGFNSFCVASIPDPGQSFHGCMLLEGWNEDWKSRYIERNYFEDDPVAKKVRGAALPFAWSDPARERELQPLEKQIMAEAASIGMAEGLCVPIYTLQGFQAAVSFGTPEKYLPQETRNALHLIAIYAHARIRDVLGAARNQTHPIDLTRREQECLKWCAAGKTSWEISQILNISQHTADWYLASAARKLGATNRVHTVAEGIRRGVIH